MAAATEMHRAQAKLNAEWLGSDRDEFVLGIGLSTGEVAAALLGSEERLEYTVVGDTVNLSQRLQDMARPGNATVVSDPTWQALTQRPEAEPMGEFTVKGRATPLTAWRVEAT
jgi:class 3 adenylate cyclase